MGLVNKMANSQKQQSKAKPKFGRLSSLGVTELHQIALYLPEKVVDLRYVITSAEALNHCLASINPDEIENLKQVPVFLGHIQTPPQIQYRPGSSPMAKINLTLRDGGYLNFSLFGTDKELRALTEDVVEEQKLIAVSGIPAMFGNSVWLNKAKLCDLDFVGTIMPVYAGKARVIKPGTVRKTISKHLDASIPLAVDFILTKIHDSDLKGIVAPEKLEIVLGSAHRPQNITTFKKALHVLDKIAAKASIAKIREHARPKTIENNDSARLDLTRWMNYTDNLEFELTDEQYTVINEVAGEINKGIPLRGMLQGDVGTGKTVIYALLAITCVLDENKNVIILLPNTALALQIHEEIHDLMPEGEKDRVLLVTAENETQFLPRVDNHAAIRVGTTSVLFKEIDYQPGLVVVDEQQKFGAKQRNQLLGQHSHLLEVSATPIPRSVALVKFGALKVWRLTKNHTKKTIESHLLIGREQGKQLITKVKETVAAGNQAIIVYALKEESDSELFGDLMSAEQAYAIWNRMFPGKVRLAHSQMSSEDKDAAITDMKNGHADVLVSTTVIEVGVTIPKAMLLATINAERFGLVALHQLRGRLARKGGHGDFFMLLPKENNSKATLERLEAMLKTNDGYELAEMDLKLRGGGDLALNSNNQTGSDDSILIGRKIDISVIDQFLSNQS